MTDTRVIITDEDIYGFEVLSPDFKPEIKVKFALDIPVSKKRILKKIVEEIKGTSIDMTKLTQEETDSLNKKYGEVLVQTIVLDWNLYDTEGVKLPIDADTLDNKISSRLAQWIFSKSTSFFTKPDKTN